MSTYPFQIIIGSIESFMNSKTANAQGPLLNREWKSWVWTNINRGCSKQEIFQQLLEKGFDRSTIIEELNYDPDDQYLIKPAKPKIKSTSESEPPKITIPIARRVETDKAELYTIDDFLNKDECEKLIELIRKDNKPSGVASYEPDQAYRTSHTCVLSHLNDSFVRAVNEQICKTIGINTSYGEGIQGQYYRIGEEFKPHTDFFEEREWASYCAQQGQRTWTFMVFLNDVDAGGVTHFTRLDVGFEPKRGRALIWNNLNPDGSPNPLTQHHGTKVKAGEKFIITKWFRERGEGVMVTREAKESAPRYTEQGFHKTEIPEALYRELLDYYQQNREHGEEEYVPGGYITGPDKKSNSRLIELPDQLKAKIHEALQPILEEWSGISLTPTFVYGIREYTHGARLWPHRDREETHIISATLNLDQDGDHSWPFEIDDHCYRRHSIPVNPGEMVLYESLTLLHSRLQTFEGHRHADIFAHFRPKEAS